MSGLPQQNGLKTFHLKITSWVIAKGYEYDEATGPSLLRGKAV